MSARLLTVAACATSLLVIAAPASAHHSASATASLAMDPAGPTCKLVEKTYRTRCKGSRVVRVTWSVSCGYPDPGVDVRFWTPRPGRSPLEMEAVEVDGTSGVLVKRFQAGTKVFATVKVYCDFPGDDTVDPHQVEAESPPTAEAFIPPRLLRVESVTNSFCGINVNRRLGRYGLQARQTSAWDFSLVFTDDSLLGVLRDTKAGRAKTVLRAKGAGIDYRGSAAPWIPGPAGRIPTAAGMRIAPRKAGRLKVWAVIGGAKTNVLTLRVLRKRCRY